MTAKLLRRIKICKRFLVKRINALKGAAYKVKLTQPTAKDLTEWARADAPGVPFSNISRDIRRVTEYGSDYDAEFDLLWRGQLLPEVIENYSERYLAHLVKNVIAPTDLDARLAACQYRTRPDGRRIWEEA